MHHLSRRSILLIACLIAAMTLTVTGTMAYLTDTDQVVNTFTVGKVQISLDETKVQADGTPETNPDDPNGSANLRTKEGNTYHLLPGHAYTKDPTVTVRTNSEPSYVRMLVTIDKTTEIEAAFLSHSKTFVPAEHVQGTYPDKWLSAGSSRDADNNLVLEYRYHEIVSTVGENAADKTLEPLFTHFTVPGFLTGEELETLADMKIQVVAQAIQADGFADANAAWAAWTVPGETGNAGDPEQPEEPGSTGESGEPSGTP